jgi:hypothetical protein
MKINDPLSVIPAESCASSAPAPHLPPSSFTSTSEVRSVHHELVDDRGSPVSSGFNRCTCPCSTRAGMDWVGWWSHVGAARGRSDFANCRWIEGRGGFNDVSHGDRNRSVTGLVWVMWLAMWQIGYTNGEYGHGNRPSRRKCHRCLDVK